MRQIGKVGLGLVVVGMLIGLGHPAPVWAAVPLAGEGALAQAGDAWRCVEVNGQVELNIRSGPGVNFQVISTRPPGEQLDADYSRLESADGYNWVPVRYPGGEGWSITGRLSPCQSDYNDPAHDVVLDDVNRDGSLDRDEIAAVARSVVLVANVRNDRIYSTGTGTITTPDGLIVTNAHVVQGADLVAVALLDDINDPPEYRYVGDVVNSDLSIDVALVAIRYDMDGNPIDAADLNLPYIPASIRPDEVFRGDPVYIFGYPGIGDDYLVVTSGTIVSVENGEMSGQRLPVWYRTDAEIAPGNSGGLAVNGNGEFVGIPTFVRSEQETGGRLGGIRPAQVALMTVLGPEMVSDPAGPSTSSEGLLLVEPQGVSLEQNVIVSGQAGLRIRASFLMEGWMSRTAFVVARFYFDTQEFAPLFNPAAPTLYRDSQDIVLTSAPITPCCEQTLYENLTLFIPYTAFGLTGPETVPLKVQIEVMAEDGSWQRLLAWEHFDYSPR